MKTPSLRTFKLAIIDVQNALPRHSYICVAANDLWRPVPKWRFWLRSSVRERNHALVWIANAAQEHCYPHMTFAGMLAEQYPTASFQRLQELAYGVRYDWLSKLTLAKAELEWNRKPRPAVAERDWEHTK